MDAPLLTGISRHIWEAKYRLGDEADIGATWLRVAHAIAEAEPRERDRWECRFVGLLEDFRFLPGGRILAGAGSGRAVTLFNCFVMGPIEDSIPGIFRALQESAVTMHQGGGVGVDFSSLRPAGAQARASGQIASGPVSFMQLWDSMCATVLATGARRGAMMATLRCDHPDIETFIDAKRTAGRLTHFNLSVQVTDAFVKAVRADEEWPLVFPARALSGDGEVVSRDWPGAPGPRPCRILRRVHARALWEKILRAAYDCAEPGVLFIDRINAQNNLGHIERISATNPCGEIPLPPYGACDLGSLNLTRFVLAPFSRAARVDFEALEASAGLAVRFLDNVIDITRFPLPAQAEAARSTRRIGLGITGLADALVMLGLAYGSPAALSLAGEIMQRVRDAAYRASAALAREKGAFPQFDRDRFLAGAFVCALPADIRSDIAAGGLRNSHLLAIAPTGTISLLAGGVSSGLEPIFAASCRRRVLGPAGEPVEFSLTDPALSQWRDGGESGAPPAFATAEDVPWADQIAMQARLQRFVDNAISKTVTVPPDTSFAAFRGVFDHAFDQGLKGCTVFRPNPVTGEVLRPDLEAHCCALDREAD
jgi:ribonucleoside-diphosphate reductase alpha chain